MVDVAKAPKIHDQEYALPDGAREVLGGVALDAIVGDDATRNALVQELNIALQGSGLEVVDTEITEATEVSSEDKLEPSPERTIKTVDEAKTGVLNPADAIRKFWSLPPQTRGYLRRRSHVEGYNGLIVDQRGKALFDAAARQLSTYYSVYYKSE